MVKQIFTEYKEGFDIKAQRLQSELSYLFKDLYPEILNLGKLRIIRAYYFHLKNEDDFLALKRAIFYENTAKNVFSDPEPLLKNGSVYFGKEFLPGQFDQDTDELEQCAELCLGYRPKITAADFYVFNSLPGNIIDAIKNYLINPRDSKEASLARPETLSDQPATPADVITLNGFCMEKDPLKIASKYSLAMSIEDIQFCQDYFSKEGRDPSMTELRVLDTYWSDHCRHTTFNTALEEITIEDDKSGNNSRLSNALKLYKEARKEVYGSNEDSTKKMSLMDMASIASKLFKKRGLLDDLDESAEVNACTVKIKADFADGSSEPWLLLFKNETHNHPTEIEPFGGASTCLGGAIRDPLSGRAHVYQALRITGGADPRGKISDTLPGKLPQVKIAREAASGYSSYGNQIGAAAGQVVEFYHPGFLAKRMELGAVIAAVPENWVKREEPKAGDLVILVGAKTGRDGIGGAAGSSMLDAGTTDIAMGAEVPKGNPPEERKIVRLFRKPHVSRLIKRCNDFGAGGVSVAVGELSDGLNINLDSVPQKYPGLDGTELAISESQERMAVVVSPDDAEKFIIAAAEENLEATVIAEVTDNKRLCMKWRGKKIVDISRDFLNSNGAPRNTNALIKAKSIKHSEQKTKASASVMLDELERELRSLRSGSRRGLQEYFDSSAGSATVLSPWGGKEQGTPECGMTALLPSLDKESKTATLMTFGYDPVTMSYNPYHGAKASLLEALAKYACLGGDPYKARLSLQEFFEKTVDPDSWGLPVAALLGALEVQLRLGIPAIGGKDSMSGNYRDIENNIDIKVPPSLVAFTAGYVGVENIRQGALSGKAGNLIIFLGSTKEAKKQGLDEIDSFKNSMEILKIFSNAGKVMAAYPVGAGGIAATMAVMSFGNMCGVEANSEVFNEVDEYNYQGSILIEFNGDTLPPLPKMLENSLLIAGRTLDEAVFRIINQNENPEIEEVHLAVLRRAYEYPLSDVYPLSSIEVEAEDTLLKVPAFDGKKTVHVRIGPSSASPLVLLPVFPGTNGEWDMEKMFRKYGANVKQVLFRNQNSEEIPLSLKELALGINNAEIIAFSGGYSPGSGNFISQILKNPLVSESLHDFLDKKDGLILGIGEGFKVLVESGLLPYGHILSSEKNNLSPITFGVNSINRHISRMVYTKVMPNVSPWLALDEEGSIHVLPLSSGEGRFFVSSEKAEELFAAGQVPFCYVDSSGKPTMDEQYNPGPSSFAIESLCSPDGRILGKMTHSERAGEYVHINVPGNKMQKIFEAGIRYFQ